ncbi:peptidase S8/S53 domain-containing protein [Lactarius quietus]|nr:peptidase S8/S53 domain-containing protein [Lactarius quietus]
MRAYRTDGIDATYTVVQVNYGGYDPNDPDVEANIDHRSRAWMMESGTSPGCSASSPTDPPTDDQHVLGARGVSVLFATGNEGVGEGNCVTNDGSVKFRPFFLQPVCPWVTAVGGTTSFGPEWAADFSGGGFSDYFERPFYQRRAVPAFLQRLGNRYNGLYNVTGRGIPDVSAQATGFRYFLNGVEGESEGTSVATPIFAAIISMLNDYRRSTGRPPLGFLNPWLYGGGLAGLTDIKRGANPGCGTPGFPATIGWDPVTGLGTPDFRRLQMTLVN